ncbi:hypothetical protein MRB53_039226 [Persea americana]|nr:hypothetical protein MRB53_039226 [Persea americana]
MLDLFTVLDKGGIVLWQKHLAPVSASVVNGLIADVFIAGTSMDTYSKSGYTVKWTMANELGLIFVAVYQSLLQLGFVEEFLENMKAILLKLHGTDIKTAQAQGTDLFRHRSGSTKPEIVIQDTTNEQSQGDNSRSDSPRILNAAKLVGGRRVGKKTSGRNTPEVVSSEDEARRSQ